MRDDRDFAFISLLIVLIIGLSVLIELRFMELMKKKVQGVL